MANVIFKRGAQASLNDVPRVDGQFLLTTDNGRLYVDVSTTGNTVKRQLLNQTVQIVSTASELPTYANATLAAAHINDFYYISSNNILAVYTRASADAAPDWVQINPDTNTWIDSLSLSAIVDNNVATITSSVVDNTDNSNTISDTMTITASNGIQLSSTSGNLSIAGDVYTLGKTVTDSTHASITLSSANNSSANSAVNIISADSNLTFSIEGNQLKATVKDTTIDSVDLSIPSAGSLSMTITDASANADEHSDTLSNVGVIVGGSGGYHLPIASTAGTTAATVYTKTEIDNLIKNLDGMTYKGSLGTGGTVTSLPTSGVKNGDMYVVRTAGMTIDWSVVSDATRGEGSRGVRIGDMFIAAGTEGADGTIGNNLVWTYIPSGNDNDALDAIATIGSANATANSFSMVAGENSEVIGRITLAAGTDIAISSTATNNDQRLETTISHGTISTSTSAASSLSTRTSTFTAIKGLTISNGHVTHIETDTFTPETYELAPASGSNSATSANVIIGLKNGADDIFSTSTLSYTSDSINLSSNTSTGVLTMNLVWSEF